MRVGSLSAYEATVPAGRQALIKTDLSIAIPPNTYARIAPRSGLAVKKMIDCGAGVVDYDYRGPVGVVLFNHGSEDFKVNKGDRVAQLILERICMADIEEVRGGLDRFILAVLRDSADQYDYADTLADEACCPITKRLCVGEMIEELRQYRQTYVRLFFTRKRLLTVCSNIFTTAVMGRSGSQFRVFDLVALLAAVSPLRGYENPSVVLSDGQRLLPSASDAFTPHEKRCSVL